MSIDIVQTVLSWPVTTNRLDGADRSATGRFSNTMTLRNDNDSMIICQTFRIYSGIKKVKGKGLTLGIAPQVDIATTKALRYMARTKQRRTYLPYTFPAIAGTHLPTPRGWGVE